MSQLVPTRLRPVAKQARHVARLTVDACARWVVPAYRYVPPLSVRFDTGAGDYLAVGREFLGHLTGLAGLRPGDAVVEPGCGFGRMAVPLLGYLDPAAGGRYDGFDVVRSQVDWAAANITRRHPHVRFAHADVWNKYYNPDGKTTAGEFVFPFGDGSADVVFLTSVFTHMFPADVSRYLSEIARVLRPAGRCLATFFLWDDAVAARAAEGRTKQSFGYAGDGYRTSNLEAPEAAIALPETFVRGAIEAAGLRTTQVRHGSWSGHADPLSYQDIVVMERGAD